MTSLYWSVAGMVDALAWARVLRVHHVQNDRVEQWICIKFVLSLNIPLWKLFRWLRRLQLWATSDWQLHHDNVPTHESHLVQTFLAKQQITQVTQTHYSPDFVTLHLLAFPKTKITFEREEIWDCWWDSGKYARAADGDWENCVRSQGAYFEGGQGIIVLCTMFLVSSSINVSIFHSVWLDTFWTDLLCSGEMRVCVCVCDLYLFIFWRTPGLFCVLALVNNTAMYMGMHTSFWDSDFISFLTYPEGEHEDGTSQPPSLWRWSQSALTPVLN